MIGIPPGELVGAFGSVEISGNLGNSFFRRFVLYLDYERQEVIFERGENSRRSCRSTGPVADLVGRARYGGGAPRGDR